MINFITGLPQAVEVDGSSFFINTDFRYWLLFDKLIRKGGATYRDISFVLEKPEEINKAVFKKLMEFYLNKNTTPHSNGNNESNIPIMDYEQDGEFIYASFRRYYNINLLTDKLHWHEFLGLLRGLFNDYKDIVGYRSYSGDDKDYIKLRNSWSLDIVDNTTDEQRRLIDILKTDGDLTRL